MGSISNDTLSFPSVSRITARGIGGRSQSLFLPAAYILSEHHAQPKMPGS
jgi:hypothetical protein